MSKYKTIIEAGLKKEMDTIGRDVAVNVAREVNGVEIDDDGKVVSLDRDGKKVLKDLVIKFTEIAGPASPTIIARGISEKGLLHKEELPDSIPVSKV